MKKLLAFMAVAVVVGSALAGCSGKKEELDVAAPPPSPGAVAEKGNPNKPMPGPATMQGGAGAQGALGR